MLKLLDRLSRESASAYARRVLIYNIVHMKLEPGEQLQEKELAECMHLSRTPLHEAVLDLKRSQIVEIVPHHGTYVACLEEKPIEDTRYLRYVFESALVERACDMRNAEIMERLLENVARQKIVGTRNRDEFLTLDEDFHGLIYDMCDCSAIYRVIREHSMHFNRMRFISFDLSNAPELIEEHDAMVRAIDAGEAAVARAMCERHLTRAISDYDEIRARYPQYFRPGKR
ncbi:MAG: GntR family transcriptional regulator [Clostridia bacterium]|nr:GntR family transcriptional regulator [Clostridia bacterium]